jgi:hypothetical protein
MGLDQACGECLARRGGVCWKRARALATYPGMEMSNVE